MVATIGTYQPSLALTETIATEGIFPPQDGDSGGMTLGMLHTYAFDPSRFGAPTTSGQILAISQNTALFSLLGTTYGGNGQTTFALPNLDGRTAVGDGQGPGLMNVDLGEQSGAVTATLTQQQLPPNDGGSSAPFNEDQPELGLKYLIRTGGIIPSQNGGGSLNMMGSVVKFAGTFAPGGYMECDGQLLSIAANPDLFSLLGTTYGGDGQTTFALPDLRGRTLVGAGSNYTIGQTFGSQSVTVGQSNLPVAMGGNATPLDNREPSLAMNYIIALQGIFPSDNGQADPATPILGEVLAFAGNFAPKGFALCQGQLLPINQNQALFALLGTTYGGNGQTTFALPDLRNRDVLGQGGGLTLGDVLGIDSITLSLDDIPSLNYVGTNAGATHYGGNGNDVISTLGGNDTVVGNGGADNIDGGTGVDKSVYSGPHASYSIVKNADGSVTITDNRVGSPDGTDHLTNVELAKFSDTTISLTPPHEFNGDNNEDILVQNPGTGQIAYGNMAGGVFQSWVNVATTPGFNVVAAGRISGGVSSNIVIQNASGQIDYAKFGATGVFSNWVPVANTPGSNVVGCADVDGDGFADVIAQDAVTGRIQFADMFNGVFQSWVNVANTPGSGVKGAADINGDGFADIVVQAGAGQIAYANMQGGVFTGWVGVPGTPGWNVSGAADINGDGFADIVIGNPTTGQIAYGNMLNGVFQSWVDVANAPGYNVSAVEDVNGDGYSDILVGAAAGPLAYANMAGGVFQGWVGVPGTPGWTAHSAPEAEVGAPAAVSMFDPGPPADAPAPVRMVDPGPQADLAPGPAAAFDPIPQLGSLFRHDV